MLGKKRATRRGYVCNVIGANPVCQFGFGFNEPSFSDRILCVVPTCEPPPPPLAPVLDHSHKRKQQKISVVEESKAKKAKLSGKECVASSVPEENERETEEVQMENKEEKEKGKEIKVEETMEEEEEEKKKKTQEGDSHCGPVVQLHVNSLLLAAKSGFFKAMFAMGMMETTQKKVFPPTTSCPSLLLFF